MLVNLIRFPEAGIEDLHEPVDGLLASYSEIMLKSRPVRRLFERKLKHNILSTLKSMGYHVKEFMIGGGRVFIQLKELQPCANYVVSLNTNTSLKNLTVNRKERITSIYV